MDSPPISDTFPDETILEVTNNKPQASTRHPWYADLVNFLASEKLPEGLPRQQRDKLMSDAKNYFWDDPSLYKLCPDQMLRRCVPDEEFESVLRFCHTLACGGHFSGKSTAAKVLQSGFFWPSLHKDAQSFCRACTRCQALGNNSKRDMMPLQPIMAVELFDIWGIDFMGPFPNSQGYTYILVAVDYVSKWIEAIPCRTADHKTVMNFLKTIFSRKFFRRL